MKFSLIKRNQLGTIVNVLFMVFLGLLFYQIFYPIELKILDNNTLRFQQIVFGLLVSSIIINRIIKHYKEYGLLIIEEERIVIQSENKKYNFNPKDCEWELFEYDGQDTSPIRKLYFKLWENGTENILFINATKQKFKFLIKTKDDFNQIKTYAQKVDKLH
jgi:hypothetical protein